MTEKTFRQHIKDFSIAKLADKLSNNIQPVDKLTGSFEAIVLALAAPVSTWMIAVPNIWLVAQFAENAFGFNIVLSVIVAIAFEGIGQGLANDWVRGRQWNAVQKDKKKVVNERGLFRRMWMYFVIDLLMVGILAAQNFGEGNGFEVFLTLLFPVVVIITTLAANERSTLYRLRRERDRFVEQQKPSVISDTQFADIERQLCEVVQRLDSLPKPHVTKNDFVSWYKNLNGDGWKPKTGADVVSGMALAGWQITEHSGRKWLSEVKK